MPIETTIDYDKTKVRFLVSCPTWDIGKGQQFPKRKWDKANRRWEFPITSFTVALLNESWPDATWTKDAERVARNALHVRVLLIPADRKPFPINYHFKRSPMPHQKLALDYTYSLDRAALFCEMRTGKTKPAIDDVVQKFLEKEIQRVLVFAPNNTLLNWLDELKKDVPIPYSAHALRLSHYREAENFLDVDSLSSDLKPVMKFAIVSYEALSSNSERAFEWAKLFIDHRPFAVICDESHWLKNAQAQRTKRVMEISKGSKRRRLLTGTEITKDLEDLYSQYSILGDVLTVDSFFAYRNRYCVMGGFSSREIMGYKNTKELFDAIRPFTFQVKRSDVKKDLPPKMIQKVLVSMTSEQAKAYKEMRKATVTSDDKPMNALTKALRLHQIAGGFVSETPEYNEPVIKMKKDPLERWISDAKINDMIVFLRDIEGQVVIWARYKIEIERICQALDRVYGLGDYFILTGDTPIEQRRADRLAFARKERRFMVGNAASGGVGIDLSVADTVMFYSSTFNYAEQVQAEDRVQSLERKDPVLYAYMICEDTIDEIIMEALEAKQSLADYLKSEIRKRKEYL